GRGARRARPRGAARARARGDDSGLALLGDDLHPSRAAAPGLVVAGPLRGAARRRHRAAADLRSRHPRHGPLGARTAAGGAGLRRARDVRGADAPSGRAPRRAGAVRGRPRVRRRHRGLRRLHPPAAVTGGAHGARRVGSAQRRHSTLAGADSHARQHARPRERRALVDHRHLEPAGRVRVGSARRPVRSRRGGPDRRDRHDRRGRRVDAALPRASSVPPGVVSADHTRPHHAFGPRRSLMKKLAVLVQLAGVLLLSGCAIGNRYAYQTVVASPQVSGTTAVSIATYDQREYVRSGTKDPQFVGLQRVIGAGAERALLLTLQEWKSDTAVRVGLSYDVTMTVLDRSGTVLAEKRLEGRDNLGGATLPSRVGDMVASAFKMKLEQLLDDSAVAAALRGGS